VERHAQTFVGSLGRIVNAPLATLMTVSVIAVALALPLLLNMFLVNLRVATASWNQAIDISAYMNKKASAERTQAAAKQLRTRSDVAAVHIITAAEALTQFRDTSGFGDALDALGDNPLPDTLVVTPAPSAAAPRDMANLEAAIASLADVQTVQIDTQWVTRLHAMLEILRRTVWLTAALLGLGVVLVVGNTIRLDILNRRVEIEVMKLVGATDAFTRRPFLYSGIWYGFGGGIVALVLCASAFALLARPVGQLAGLYGSDFRIHGLDLGSVTTTLVIAVLLGWTGSWIAATRHIQRIAPT